MKNFSLKIILGLLLSTFISGCGGGGSDASTATPSVTPEDTLIEPTPAVLTTTPTKTTDAFVSLYDSTNGANWLNNTNWLQGDPCAKTWFGVTCNDKNEVIHLNLSKNNLQGSIPAYMVNIKTLKSLDLSANMLTGNIPSDIGNLQSLTSLNLSTNNLTGTIPSSINKLTSITDGYLRLDQNSFCKQSSELESILEQYHYKGLSYFYLNQNNQSQCPDRKPISYDQNITFKAESQSNIIHLINADEDGNILNYVIKTNPINGTLSGMPPELTYTPNADFIGTDTFTFVSNDGTTDSEIITITINIVENMSLRLTDKDFNAYSNVNKLKIADKLLATLFFGYPLNQLESDVSNGNFISSIESKLNMETDQTYIDEIEEYIEDESVFKYETIQQEGRRPITKLLVRFYAMNTLNDYFVKHWIAYTLTQTIMFSPSYGLVGTVTSEDVTDTYNRLLDIDNTYNGDIRGTTKAHISSESNWRRFRSPEDNGREMMEIFLLDTNDTHVPLAAQALQNWKLIEINGVYRLDISGEENSESLNLFNTTVTNGESFYNALVESEEFLTGVTTRLVDYFLPKATIIQKKDLIEHIVDMSKPTTWKALIFDIIFSKIYLLETEKILSPEELFYSFAKKTDFTHSLSFFEGLHDALIAMNYAPMKAKLGKVNGIGSDTSSFAAEHSYFYRWIFTRFHAQNYIDYDISHIAARTGINLTFIDYEQFGWVPNAENWNNYYGGEDGKNDIGKYEISISFIQYLFKATIRRMASQEELDQIMYRLQDHTSTRYLKREFDMFQYPAYIGTSVRTEREIYFAALVLNYIARLTEVYIYGKVEK